jgi:hypothetical protein
VLKPCDCGNPGVLTVTVTDQDETVLDTVTLCADCANAHETSKALDTLGLQIGVRSSYPW